MNLNELRGRVDEIDERLLQIFEERMKAVSQIAELKKAEKLPVLDRGREEEKLNAISEKASEETKKYARILYSTLFNLSRKYQHAALRDGATKLQEYSSALVKEISEAKKSYSSKEMPSTTMVACQGMEGSFAELATERLFKQSPAIQYMKTYDSVFAAIENGFCDYGVLPLENSTAGSVNKVYRVMQNHNFKIVRSIRLKIDHCLVAPKDVKLEDIREVVSHEQALAQCDVYLNKLNATQTQFNNTAAAAEMVANSARRDIAAICSQRGAEQYGLEILASNIQDNANNFTRFICISKNLEIYEGANLTDMILTLKNKQGSLFEVMKKINGLGIDLGKLESRPTDSDEDFMFYVTFKTAVNDELFALIDALASLCKDFEYLGSYTEVI
ncbi:MAG: chorismate mutase [Clostridiales bacterium]|jgi:chorismate mutase/prephenate dehydratase|nr:chorismate mutase [Clostridiales bacterium]